MPTILIKKSAGRKRIGLVSRAKCLSESDRSAEILHKELAIDVVCWYDLDRSRGDHQFACYLHVGELLVKQAQLENALDPLIDSSFESLVSVLIPCWQPLLIDAM